MKNDEHKKRFECPALPKGWIREEVLRTGTWALLQLFLCIISISEGLSAGKHDVYYYPPEGKPKCRSKPEMAKVLGDSLDLSGFDFSTGVFTSTGSTFSPASSVRPSGGRDRENPKTDFMKGARCSNQRSDNQLPPIRQTASIFKQPVTVVKVWRLIFLSELCNFLAPSGAQGVKMQC